MKVGEGFSAPAGSSAGSRPRVSTSHSNVNVSTLVRTIAHGSELAGNLGVERSAIVIPRTPTYDKPRINK